MVWPRLTNPRNVYKIITGFGSPGKEHYNFQLLDKKMIHW